MHNFDFQDSIRDDDLMATIALQESLRSFENEQDNREEELRTQLLMQDFANEERERQLIQQEIDRFTQEEKKRKNVSDFERKLLADSGLDVDVDEQRAILEEMDREQNNKSPTQNKNPTPVDNKNSPGPNRNNGKPTQPSNEKQSQSTEIKALQQELKQVEDLEGELLKTRTAELQQIKKQYDELSNQKSIVPFEGDEELRKAVTDSITEAQKQLKQEEGHVMQHSKEREEQVVKLKEEIKRKIKEHEQKEAIENQKRNEQRRKLEEEEAVRRALHTTELQHYFDQHGQSMTCQTGQGNPFKGNWEQEIKNQSNRDIRDEQNRAYEESLEMDRAKEQSAKQRELELKREEQRKKEEEEKKKREEEEQKQMDQAISMSTELDIERRLKELEVVESELPKKEDSSGPRAAELINIAINFGSKRQIQSFWKTDKIEKLKQFIDLCLIREKKNELLDAYEIVTLFPRAVYNDYQKTFEQTFPNTKSVALSVLPKS